MFIMRINSNFDGVGGAALEGNTTRQVEGFIRAKECLSLSPKFLSHSLSLSLPIVKPLHHSSCEKHAAGS
jgi:hypothetical protein